MRHSLCGGKKGYVSKAIATLVSGAMKPWVPLSAGYLNERKGDEVGRKYVYIGAAVPPKRQKRSCDVTLETEDLGHKLSTFVNDLCAGNFLPEIEDARMPTKPARANDADEQLLRACAKQSSAFARYLDSLVALESGQPEVVHHRPVAEPPELEFVLNSDGRRVLQPSALKALQKEAAQLMAKSKEVRCTFDIKQVKIKINSTDIPMGWMERIFQQCWKDDLVSADAEAWKNFFRNLHGRADRLTCLLPELQTVWNRSAPSLVGASLSWKLHSLGASSLPECLRKELADSFVNATGIQPQVMDAFLRESSAKKRSLSMLQQLTTLKKMSRVKMLAENFMRQASKDNIAMLSELDDLLQQMAMRDGSSAPTGLDFEEFRFDYMVALAGLYPSPLLGKLIDMALRKAVECGIEAPVKLKLYNQLLLANVVLRFEQLRKCLIENRWNEVDYYPIAEQPYLDPVNIVREFWVAASAGVPSFEEAMRNITRWPGYGAQKKGVGYRHNGVDIIKSPKDSGLGTHVFTTNAAITAQA